MTAAGKDMFIEQLRGIAILLVVVFHYTNRISPSALGADSPPLFEFYSGIAGVHLFFGISGYLIAKTLYSSAALGEFYAKRLSRIWPLFVLGNVTVFLWTRVFDAPVVPEGVKSFDVGGRSVYDLIGTTFFLHDLGFEWIDGVHWSILVELKYYAAIGLLCAAFRRRGVDVFCWTAACLGLLDLSLHAFGDAGGTLSSRLLHGVLIAQYLPFFAVGMMLYHGRHDMLLAVCVLLCFSQLVDSASVNPDFSVGRTLEFLALLAGLLVVDQVLLKGRICGFFGKYSYSIYLFHQVIGLSLIMMLTPPLGIDLAILVATVLVLAVSVVASWLVEWRYRRPVTSLLMRAGAAIGLDRLRFDMEPSPRRERGMEATP
jgi:peptidoglycan/LPS O-acetylase OafA/YrhL